MFRLLDFAARSTRLSISLRSVPKSNGLVRSAPRGRGNDPQQFLRPEALGRDANPIMPTGKYPLTPEHDQAQKPRDGFRECDACPEMVVVTVRISTLRSREEREALRDAPLEAESR